MIAQYPDSIVSKCGLAYMSMRVHHFGSPTILKQKSGVQIGSPVSGTLLRLVLSRCESAFDSAAWGALDTELDIDGPLWIETARYVSDLLLASHCLCHHVWTKSRLQCAGRLYRSRRKRGTNPEAEITYQTISWIYQLVSARMRSVLVSRSPNLHS